METVRVLVADKNALISDGICALLKNFESIDVVGAVTTGKDIIDVMRGQAPDVVLMDIAMPLAESVEVIHRIRNESSDVKILLVSEHEDRDCIIRGLKAGVNGYIPKRATSSDLVAAILAVYRGGYFLYPSIAKIIVGEYLRIRQGLSPDPYDQLSNSEKEVLKLLAEGYKSQQIAEALNTVIQTVIKHKSSITAKLGIRNRTELIKYAIRKHLIEL